MKKILAALLAAMMLLTLAACGGNSGTKTVDVQKLADDLKENVPYSAEMIADAVEELNYKMDPPEGTTMAGYIADGNAYDMIVVGQCASEEDAKTLYANVQTYVSDLKTEAGRYSPEEVARLDGALLRQTGSLIESPSGYLHLTAQENLEIVADLKGVPYKDIDRVLEIVHLQADRKRKVGQYSLGMKQRLGIAMALLGSPRLLILDEPTNGLDPAGIQEMRALIHDMPDACGATVLISSHLLGEMEQIVSQVGIINHGQLLFEGPLAELQRHSRGNVVLRLLAPDRGAAVLRRYGLTPQPADNGCLLPTMEDARLAALVQDLAAEGAGVVGVERQTKNLEEIFLSLTNTQTGKEVG